MPFPRLTFGIEFEFNLAHLPCTTPDPDSTDPRPIHQLYHLDHNPSLSPYYYPWTRSRLKATRVNIATLLTAAGLPAAATGIVDPEGATHKPEAIWHSGCWTVTEDSTILNRYDRAYDWYGIEIQSPPYLFCDEAIEAVKLACRTLTQNYRCLVNTTCGLHVHVGNGIEGWDLLTLKKLAAFLWVFEPPILDLHPKERHHNFWCYALRGCSTLAGFFQERRDQTGQVGSVLEAVELIFKKQETNEVMDLITGKTNQGAYNPLGLRTPYESDLKRTIEFRQHEGTLDGERATQWVRTVCGILQFVEEVELNVFMEMILKCAADEDMSQEGGSPKTYGVVQLLNDVGLGDQSEYYKSVLESGILRRPGDSDVGSDSSYMLV